MSELKPCPFCGRKPYESGGYVSCHTEECLANADYHEPAIGSIEHWNTRPIEDELRARIAELEAGLISAGKQEVETKNRLLKERDKKIANLHKVIAKQQLKIQRQAENITTLLHLYTSGKRSKSHKKLREKYRALKARMR